MKTKAVFSILCTAIFLLHFNPLHAQWDTSGNHIHNTNSGNVGIGLTAPNFKLDISGTGVITRLLSTNANSYLHFQNSSTGSSGASDGFIMGASGLDGYFEQREDASILFRTNGTQRMVLNNIGNLGIGESTPTAKLHLTDASTTTSNYYAINLFPTRTITSSSSSADYIINSQTTFAGTGGSYTNAIGLHNQATISSTGTGTLYRGTYSRVNMSGDGAASGVALYSSHFEGSSTGTITDWYGMVLGNLSGISHFTNSSNTLTNTYGLYIGDLTNGTQTNQPYAIYQDDSDVRNYFAGNVGIGITAPTKPLSVKGQIFVQDVNGLDNVMIGNAGNTTMTGKNNIFIGDLAGLSNTTGRWNNALGDSALYANTTGIANNAFGYWANGNNTTGSFNVSIGNATNYMNTTGSNNTAVGAAANYSNTTGSDNNVFGYLANNWSTEGSNNNVFGRQASYHNTVGTNNNIFGYEANFYNTTGSYNNSMGHHANNKNTTGSHNNSFGFQSNFSNTTGIRNQAFGFHSNFSNTTGSENIAFGFRANYSNTTGSRTIAIGYEAGYNNTSSDRLYIANNATEALIYGEFDNELLVFNGKVGVGTSTIPTGYEFAVDGDIIATKVTVQEVANWPDFVFAKDYELMPLKELAEYIAVYNHLPNVPSAKEVQEDGIDLGEMDARLLQKVEELTLHLIVKENEVSDLYRKMEEMEKRLSKQQVLIESFISQQK